ncbi:MAG: hypothetical protein ABJN69_15060 [Hellea sp.]
MLLFGLTACTASNTLENTVTAERQTHEAQSYDKKTKDIQSEGTQVSGPVMTLRTVMTAEGVECPAVRGEDGTLYTIPSMPHKFDEGDVLNIIVANPIVPVASFCQQGETIDWIRIEKLSVSGEILKQWEK